MAEGGMLREWRWWKAIVDKHYGSLDGFDHAGSVRHMRSFIVKDLELEDVVRQAMAIDPVALDEYVRDTEDEYQELKRALSELDAWLAKRGLQP